METSIVDFPKKKELIKTLRQNNVVFGALFGSRAKGVTKPESDYDLLVKFNPKTVVPFSKFSRIYDKIKKILGKDVDLVTTNGLGQKSFKKEVSKTMKVFYDERKG